MIECLLNSELRLMFSLMDRVPDGITPMLQDLEEHIIHQGLADMIAAANTITSVCTQSHYNSHLIIDLVLFSVCHRG